MLPTTILRAGSSSRRKSALHLPLVLALLVSPTLFAQQNDKDRKDEDDKWNGLRAGYHLSNMEGDLDTESRSGFYGGYFRNIIKVPFYRLSTGLEFNTAGASVGTSESRLSYITVPFNNRLQLGPVFFDLGADFAVKIGEKYLADGTEVDLPDDEQAERIDALLHAGVGFKFLMLGVEARYRYGLTEVFEGYRNTGLELGLCTFF